MSVPSHVHIVDASTGHRRRVVVGEQLGAGASASVHRLPDIPGTAVKLYFGGAEEQRIRSMLASRPNLPAITDNGRTFEQMAWPTALAESSGRFAGFTMPLLDVASTSELEPVLNIAFARRSGLRHDLGTRAVLARQLAGVVAELHAQKHYVVDLKPINMRFYRDTLYMALIDCDGFSIHDADTGRQLAAPHSTGEYVAPEFQNGNPNDDPEAQDRFALAVIVFKLFNYAAHPYACILKDPGAPRDLVSNIANRRYAYGHRPDPACKPRVGSVHTLMPDELRDMFDRAFGRVPDLRPSAEQWSKVLSEYANRNTGRIEDCTANPEHRHFTGHACAACKVDIPSPAATAPRPQQIRPAHSWATRPTASAPQPSPPKRPSVAATPVGTVAATAVRKNAAPGKVTAKRVIGFLTLSMLFAFWYGRDGTKAPESTSTLPATASPAQPRPPVYPTSFDCLRSSGPSERAICQDSDLARLDRTMAALYRKAVAKNSTERTAQRAWLKTRSTRCGSDTECLGSLYRERIGQLNEAIAPVVHAPAPVSDPVIVPAQSPPAVASDAESPSPAQPSPVAAAPETLRPSRPEGRAARWADAPKPATTADARDPTEGAPLRRLLVLGEQAFSAQNYSAAIANAQAVLAIDPGNGRARSLLDHAKQAQEQAMNSITIQ